MTTAEHAADTAVRPANPLTVRAFRNLWFNNVAFFLVLNAQRFVFGWLVLDGLLRKGAVGDIALRYYDAQGECIESEINDRIIGMSLEQIKQVPKVVGISGGPDKVSAIRAALRGEIVNVLITDSVTAEALLESDHG